MRNVLRIWGLLFILFFLIGSWGCENQKNPDYKNRELPVEARIDDLLKRLTLDEKVSLMGGMGFESKSVERLGIPSLKMTDGPNGVRDGNRATSFPAVIAMAATWDTDLVNKIGVALGRETRALGHNFLLGPCVNIHRIPYGGRNFESFGEDPYLTSRMTVAYIKGVQSQNVLTSVKHFACNNQEWNRHHVNVMVDERSLREIYLPAFKAAVKEADVWSVMAAYNKVNGQYCTENFFLVQQILKEEWGFKGFVVSDWGATQDAVRASKGGLDMEMPYDEHFGKPLLGAVRKGEISKTSIDDNVRRLLRSRFKAGLFDSDRGIDTSIVNSAGHRSLALQAATGSMVLLKNNEILPLNSSDIATLALIGPNAARAITGGGGTSLVKPFYAVSPLEAFQNKIGDKIKILYAIGSAAAGDVIPVEVKYLSFREKEDIKAGLKGLFFNNKNLAGNPLFDRIDREIYYDWGFDSPHPSLHEAADNNIFSVRWRGHITPPVSGIYKFNFICNDGIRLVVNGHTVIDQWVDGPVSLKSGTIHLKGGKSVPIQIEYYCNESIAVTKLGWEVPGYDPLREAVEIAKQSDVVVIVGGLNSQFESESYDRQRLDLPKQDRLIRAVSAANPKTIVVLQSGSPIQLNRWKNQVAGILLAWYPGQECGSAIADVLLGHVNPSGKLPFSYIKRPEDCPGLKGYKDPSLSVHYHEGIFVGYRYMDRMGIKPHYPFGFGLSYSSFRYRDCNVEPMPNGDIRVFLNVKNDGPMDGAEVVQIYIKDRKSSVERPEKELKGFKKVFLKSRENQDLLFILRRGDFSFFSVDQNKWVFEPGEFEVMIGSSSRNIHYRKRLNL